MLTPQYILLALFESKLKLSIEDESRASVEGNEVFPKDAEAAKFRSWDVGLSGFAAVGVRNSEGFSDLTPGGGVDTSHGLVGGVVEIMGEFSSSGLVGEGGDNLVNAE